jgi:hypothetical protein
LSLTLTRTCGPRRVDGQLHAAALAGAAQGVVHQVLHDTLDQGDVGQHQGLDVAACRQFEAHAALLRRQLVVEHHVLQQLGQAEGLAPQFHPPGLELREFEQFVDAPAQGLDMAQGGAQVLGPILLAQ